ncbi:MAG TPA: hypothetical protein VK826_11105 [Bacteroidia bacterium]|nr:hypothetical protein [Bacteroidia bacterium]
MKWYAYPLALVAWLLVAIYIFIFTWNYIGDHARPDWDYFLLIVAAIFLGVSFVLTRFKFAWELEVVIQVVFVLGPLLWYLNQREPYRPPVYVFMIEAGYTGEVRATFTNDENTKTQVRSTADTLYFRFNGEGQILLNEDFRTVREAVASRFYFLYPDGSRKKIAIVNKNAVVKADSTSFSAYEDTLHSVKGKIEYISWQLQRSDRLHH